MHATVDAISLAKALKQLQPRAKFKSMQERFVTATAGGSSIVFVGSLDSSASVDAVVNQSGSAAIPLDAAIRLLKTYGKSDRVEIRSEVGATFLDKVRFSIG